MIKQDTVGVSAINFVWHRQYFFNYRGNIAVYFTWFEGTFSCAFRFTAILKIMLHLV